MQIVVNAAVMPHNGRYTISYYKNPYLKYKALVTSRIEANTRAII